MRNRKSLIYTGLKGAGFGLLLSIMYPVFWFYALYALAIFYFLVIGHKRTWANSLVGFIGIVVTVFICWKVPGPLDRNVPVLDYPAMPLEVLNHKLSQDHGIYFALPDSLPEQGPIAFKTERALTRRDVLKALAEQANLDLSIFACGNTATILGGADSYVTLRAKNAYSAKH